MKNIWHFIYKIGGRINTHLIKRQEKINLKKWQKNFTNNTYFDFKLNTNINLRLYKDSILSKYIFEGFEKDELNFVEKFLKNGEVFFDIGANIGIFSLVASIKVGRSGMVFAFEPTKLTYNRLIENIQLNSFENIKPFNYGLSNINQSLNLYISENGFDAWNSFAKIKEDLYTGQQTVEVKRLDDIILENNIKQIDLIKIDVEGWEKFVLLGGEKFLKNANNVVLIIEFTEENAFAAGYYAHEIYDLLDIWGYKWFSYSNNTLLEEKKRLHYPYNNFIASKNKDIILKKINNTI